MYGSSVLRVLLWLCLLYCANNLSSSSLQFNAADYVVAVDVEARKKKLSKDFLYLFNKLNAWQLDMTEVGDCYEECFYGPLEPHLYSCKSIAELVKCKYLNQILEVRSLFPPSVLR